MSKLPTHTALMGFLSLVLAAGLSLGPHPGPHRAAADPAPTGLGDVIDVDLDAWGAPDVAWNQSCDQFLVVFEHKRTDVDYNIFARYIPGTGQAPLVGGVFQITTDPMKQASPAVAFNQGGFNYLVVWEDYRDGHWEIYAQLWNCQKQPVNDAVRITPDDGAHQLRPDASCGYQAGGCWVVWEDLRDGNWNIYGHWLAASGVWLDPGGDLIGENVALTSDAAAQRTPAITYNPEDTGCELASFFTVWEDRRNAGSGNGYDIYGQQLADGDLCGGGNVPIYVGQSDQLQPDIAYGTTNNRYLVVWEEQRRVNLVYFPLLLAGGQTSTAVRTSDSQPQAPLSDSWDIVARRIRPNGTTDGNSFALTTNPLSQTRPAVAYDAATNNEFLTVWQDMRAGNSDIFAQRTGGGGDLLGGNNAVIGTASSQGSPAVAFGAVSDHYFVVWSETGVKGRAVWP